jgi:hypothetical protein
MPEQELDLLQLAACGMPEPGARASAVVRRQLGTSAATVVRGYTTVGEKRGSRRIMEPLCPFFAEFVGITCTLPVTAR